MDLPYSEDLGSGLFVMDVAPDDGCPACGHWAWGFSMVDCNPRVDLLTDKPINHWTGRSDCLKCGMTHKWKVTPDHPYPTSHDDPFAK